MSKNIIDDREIYSDSTKEYSSEENSDEENSVKNI